MERTTKSSRIHRTTLKDFLNPINMQRSAKLALPCITGVFMLDIISCINAECGYEKLILYQHFIHPNPHTLSQTADLLSYNLF